MPEKSLEEITPQRIFTPVERFFAFCENGMVLAVMGIAGGLAGVVADGRYLLLWSVPLLFGLHRSGALSGLRPSKKRSIFIAVFVISSALLWFLGLSVNKSREHIPTVAEIVKGFLGTAHPVAANAPSAPPAPSYPVHQRSPLNNPRPAPGPAVIEPPPAFGNLADRANQLADEIMADLYRFGWPQHGTPNPAIQVLHQMPKDERGNEKWNHDRALDFRIRYLNQVRDVRNEFLQLHLRDDRLDDLLTLEAHWEEANKGANGISPDDQPSLPSPAEIEEIARRLRALAGEMPIKRDPPESLPFTVNKEPINSRGFSLAIVTTITPDKELDSGYIAVEYSGIWGTIDADLADSQKNVRGPDDDPSVEGNTQLRDFLSHHTNSNCYVMKIGPVAVTPERPVHFFVKNNNEEFAVSRVLYFEK